MYRAPALVYINGRCWFAGETGTRQIAANDAFAWGVMLVRMSFQTFTEIRSW